MLCAAVSCSRRFVPVTQVVEPQPDAAENDKAHAFDDTLAEIRAAFADLSPEELQALVDEAIEAVREGKL